MGRLTRALIIGSCLWGAIAVPSAVHALPARVGPAVTHAGSGGYRPTLPQSVAYSLDELLRPHRVMPSAARVRSRPNRAPSTGILIFMDPVDDPFTPGAGVAPPFLAGRDQALGDFEIELRRALTGKAVRSRVLTGVRGMGKTVLLNEMKGTSEELGWAVVNVEANGTESFAAQLADRAQEAMVSVGGGPALRERLRNLADRVRGISLSASEAAGPAIALNLDVTTEGAIPGARQLAEVLTTTAAATREQAGTGLVVIVDELQQVDDVTLLALALAAHRASQESAPLMILGAGLPELPGRLANVATYTERLFAFVDVGSLHGDAFDDAIREALRRHDVGIDLEALARLATETSGYPFFVQTYGSAAWITAAGPTITADDVVNAMPRAEGALKGFFAARWHSATAPEQRYLRALASHGDGPLSHALASRQAGLDRTHAGEVRRSLRLKALIFDSESSVVALTVPHFSAFILAEPE